MLNVVRGSPHPPTVQYPHPYDKANQQIRGLLGDHDGQRPVGKFGQDAEVTPLLFLKDIFNDHRESGP